ncbi:MAG: nucleotidyl transferase AbiEii/AbiGii toxin family protein [Gemmatimonadota bacterium]
MGSRPPDFEALLARVAAALRAQGIEFMVIGGQAVLLHGEPRLTQDIDITLAVTPDHLDQILAACKEAELRVLPEKIEDFVRNTFVLPAVSPETGIRVDMIFSSTSYEKLAIRRAVRVTVRGTEIPFATAEDLLLHKLFAGRPRDLEDAAGVVRRKRDDIDWTYLERWAAEFAVLPGRETLLEQVRRLRD